MTTRLSRLKEKRAVIDRAHSKTSLSSVDARSAPTFATAGSSMKILVTGSNGFISSVVVRMLRARGLDVRCMVRRTSRLDQIRHLGCELVVGNLLDFSSLPSAARGCDVVIHLAGIAKWSLTHSPFHVRCC